MSPDPRSLGAAEDAARAYLRAAIEDIASKGGPVVEVRGKLVRPVVSFAGLDGGEPPAGFAEALAAIQLAHEASLVHDDIIDGAGERRGAPSVVASEGVASALVHGDHLLTTAYLMAAHTGSMRFTETFARAVERTVAGESRQAAVANRRIDAATQQEISGGKSGALFGCALCAASALRDEPMADTLYALGCRLGIVYQRVDDLLDYLPHATTGKPALSDYRHGLWTWPLDLLGVGNFDADVTEVARRLCQPDTAGRTPLDRACEDLADDVAGLRAELRQALGPSLLDLLLDRWVEVVETARTAAPDHPPAVPPPDQRRAVPAARSSMQNGAQQQGGESGQIPTPPQQHPTPGVAVHSPDGVAATAYPWPDAPATERGWIASLSKGSRSFRFAAHLFPAEDRRRVAGVYSFCRYTDDLVDRAEGLAPEQVEQRLDAWCALAASAYLGGTTGVGLLDATMREAAARGVPFRYIEGLIDGMRMDLRPRTYATLSDLRTYTYRVASVVGLWLTELHGVRAPAVLERAATLGHAMQLTNILRDVGEDMRAGRLYIPVTLLAAHGLDRAALERMADTGHIQPAWKDLVESLMVQSESWYREAFVSLPALPRSFQRPVAVAARVYRGIHDAIRANDYDNLRRRAFTSPVQKVKLGAAGLIELRRTRASSPFQPHDTSARVTDFMADGASGARGA